MATRYSPDVITDGLISYLDSANIKSYPGSGTSWTDLTGNGNNATLLNGASISNSAASLVDRNDSIFLGEKDFSSYDAFSVEVLYKRNGVNDTGTGGAGQPSYYQGIFNYYWQGGHSIYVGTTSNASSTNLTVFGVNTTLELNTWVHILGVTGPFGKKAYINGQLVGTANGASIDANKRIYFGNWDTSWASFCNISFCKIYNRELTAAEVLQNYNATKGRFGL